METRPDLVIICSRPSVSEDCGVASGVAGQSDAGMAVSIAEDTDEV